jgi:6-pyruvoyl-tetrahydropterin synthase
MFSVSIRDFMMIAHSLPSEAFGPASKMHGATYIVDAEFRRSALDENNIVIDIAIAHEVIAEVLAPLKYQNLDEMPEFRGKLTTTEFLAHYVHQKVGERLAGKFKGELKITLHESHLAWAAYEGPIGA